MYDTSRKFTKRVYELRYIAHIYFDTIVRYKAYRLGIRTNKVRAKTYKWLAKKLGIKKESCHFGMMKEGRVEEAINLMALEYAKNDNLMEFAESYEEGGKMSKKLVTFNSNEEYKKIKERRRRKHSLLWEDVEFLNDKNKN